MEPVGDAVAGNRSLTPIPLAEEALETIDEALETFGANRWIQATRVSALLVLGRTDEAIRASLEMPVDTPFFGLTTRVRALVAAGRVAEARAVFDEFVARNGTEDIVVMEAAALLGERELANGIAARLDARPGGSMILLVSSANCQCGEEFDLSATPNFAARIAESGAPWPLPELMALREGGR